MILFTLFNRRQWTPRLQASYLQRWEYIPEFEVLFSVSECLSQMVLFLSVRRVLKLIEVFPPDAQI